MSDFHEVRYITSLQNVKNSVNLMKIDSGSYFYLTRVWISARTFLDRLQWHLIQELSTNVNVIHSAVCRTSPWPLPKRVLHTVRPTTSCFEFQYPLFTLRSTSSFLRLLHCLSVTSILPFIFPWIRCFTRQFLSKIWPIQLSSFLHLTVFGTFLLLGSVQYLLTSDRV